MVNLKGLQLCYKYAINSVFRYFRKPPQYPKNTLLNTSQHYIQDNQP